MTVAVRPASLDEAVRALAEPGAVAVAGCTDLLVVDTATRRRHDRVVDVHRLPELRGVRVDGDALDLGAALTFTELRRSAEVQRHAPALAQAAATVGGWQIQNRGTLGGNIANASPAGDSLPALLALDAELVLVGPGGERRLPYGDFHVGYRATALGPGELIARVRVPIPPDGHLQAFEKVGTRQAQAISKVVVALAARRDGGVLRDVRLAAGSVAATPVRLVAAERAAEGRIPDEETTRRAADAARGEVTPIDDVRSTAEYRLWVLGRVVRRLLAGSA